MPFFVTQALDARPESSGGCRQAVDFGDYVLGGFMWSVIPTPPETSLGLGAAVRARSIALRLTLKGTLLRLGGGSVGYLDEAAGRALAPRSRRLPRTQRNTRANLMDEVERVPAGEQVLFLVLGEG